MPVPNFNPNQFYPQPGFPGQYQTQSMQIQNGGFISVPSEEVARNYPVAPGNSITFKNENAPYIYTKTMGFSQLDSPLFERYKLVKEEDSQLIEDSPKLPEDIAQTLQSQIDKLWGELNALKQPAKKSASDEKRKNSRGGSRYDKQHE